ncbi:hypothetical protein ACHAXN_003016 [Cyclotella atomus]
MHSRISSSINNFLSYCESNNVDVIGITRSIVVGLCISISAVVALSVYPGQPLGIFNATEGDDLSERQPSNEIVVPPGLQTISGLSKEQIKLILQSMQQQDYCKENPNIVNGESSISTISFIKMLVFVGLLSSLVLVLNRDYNNIVTVLFVRTFPRESSIFGLSVKNEL